MVSVTEPHDPTVNCLHVHCMSHNVDEYACDTTYLICGECFHTYQTAQELRKAYRREAWRVHRANRKWAMPKDYPLFKQPSTWAVLWRILTIRAKDIYFCQHCIHDF